MSLKNILFILFITIGCSPSELKVEENDSQSRIAEEQSPITWSDCSSNIGDHPCDFSLTNHVGDTITLYELYGKPIVVDFSTMWCYYCQMAGYEINTTLLEFDGKEVVYITILMQNFQGGETTQSDLSEWVDHFNLDPSNAPVLGGHVSLVDPNKPQSWFVEAWPTFYFIDENMIIQEYMRGFSSVGVKANIEKITQ